jgi:O-antigen/teichoic acid export membrane protein
LNLFRQPQTLFAAALGTSVASLLTTIFTFVSGVLIARALDPDGRGEYGTILLIGQTGATLFCLSFFDGAIIALRREPDLIHAILPTMLIVALSLSLGGAGIILSILSLLPPDLHQINSLSLSLIVAILILDMILWQCFAAIERSQMTFSIVNLSGMLPPCAFSILIVLAWLGPEGSMTVDGVLWLFIAAKLPMQIIWFTRHGRDIFGRISTTFVHTAGRTGLRLHMAIALGLIASHLDRLIVIAAWPSVMLGHYFVALSAVGAGFAAMTSTINIVLLPVLSGLTGNDLEYRVSHIIRLTLLISLGAVIGGLCILPFAIPLLYGQAYLPATSMSTGLLLAFAVLPLRTVILETGRSLGKGRSSVEMSLVTFTVMFTAFLVTKFETPGQLIFSLGLANVLSTIVGGRYLVLDGVIRIGPQLLPRLGDIRQLGHSISLHKRLRK